MCNHQDKANKKGVVDKLKTFRNLFIIWSKYYENEFLRDSRLDIESDLPLYVSNLEKLDTYIIPIIPTTI